MWGIIVIFVTYPPARSSNLVDTIHGVAVPDPYRWLEDPESAETRGWVERQNALTRSFLDGPERGALVRALTAAYDRARVMNPLRRGHRYFFLYNSGLQAQAALFLQEGLDGTPRVLLDPNTLSDEGIVALTALQPSDAGTRIAYALSRGGSDEQEIRIRDVGTGQDLGDLLQWVKFTSIAWTPDEAGFYYLRFPAPGSVPPGDEQYFGRIYFHRVGDPQSADRLIFADPDEKEVVPRADVTRDGRFVVVTAQRGASDDSEIYLIDRSAGDGTARPLFTGFDAAYFFIADEGGRLFFRTTKEAPFGRVIAVRPDDPTLALDVVVPETSDRLVDAVLARDTLAASYLHNASTRLERFDTRSFTSSPIVPRDCGVFSVTTMDAQPDAADVVMALTSFTQPPTAFRYDPVDDSIAVIGPARPEDLRSDAYDTRQVWYASKDGTRISMFLVQRADLPRDSPRPVLLSGYGGFNISRTPMFDPGLLPFLDRGGIFALANLRGGGEYGEDWHRAGMLERKQNVFDDFIAAAEYLISAGYTAPSRLAIEGGSNGGLLVGAVTVQRPDLFGAVICRVPVADMLRYHLFTIGRFWIPEYGSADDPDQFRFLLAYSPYHNVREGVTYPPVLVMTADTDDRVSPGMAKKFAARLQTAGRGGPFLIRVETRAGHGAGKPVSKLIDEDADILAFLEKTVGLASTPARC